MDMQTTFWMLMMVTALELLAIYVIGNAITAVLQSDIFKKKLEKKRQLDQEQESKKKNNGENHLISILLLLVTVTFPSLTFGADVTKGSGPLTVDVTSQTLYIILAFDVLLLGVIWYLKNLLQTIVNIDKTEEELAAKKKAKKKINLVRVLTDAVPVEDEASVATDHEYDGIRELDNNLPPWWKWGFYLSIVIGIIYLLNFHVFKTGDLQIETYNKEMVQAEKDIQAYLEAQAMNVDENSVTLMTNATDLSKGEKLFMDYCKVCHGGAGEGLVGPNLTDDYWLSGGKINHVFKTIKYGAERGMKSWKDELNPIEMQQVASFIKSLKGTNPFNPKEPEGELYIEEEIKQPVDSISTNMVSQK